jgi:hypothetical protein
MSPFAMPGGRATILRMDITMWTTLFQDFLSAAVWHGVVHVARRFWRQLKRPREVPMPVIHKIPLSLDEPTTFDADGILHIGEQDGTPMAWVIRGRDRGASLRHTVAIRGTGTPFPDHWGYKGTVQIGALVWHVLECGQPRLAPVAAD